jgi:hypothetical protein
MEAFKAWLKTMHAKEDDRWYQDGGIRKHRINDNVILSLDRDDDSELKLKSIHNYK